MGAGRTSCPRATASSALDAALDALRDRKDRWATLPARDKIALLLAVRSNLKRAAPQWVEVSVKAKQLDPASPWVGEEWVTGPGRSPRASTAICARSSSLRGAPPGVHDDQDVLGRPARREVLSHRSSLGGC